MVLLALLHFLLAIDPVQHLVDDASILVCHAIVLALGNEINQLGRMACAVSCVALLCTAAPLGHACPECEGLTLQ